MTREGTAVRRTEQGTLIDVTVLRGFARAALDHDAVQDEANDLLCDRVIDGRYHPSVVADSLRPMIIDRLDAMTAAGRQAVADELIKETREALGEQDGRA